MRTRGDRSGKERPGFTIVELLIVVVVLCLMAGIVVPSLPRPVDDTRASTVRSDLRVLRDAIELYRAQHGRYPGYDASRNPKEETFLDQLLGKTNAAGETPSRSEDPAFPLGPYLRSIPTNPYNGSAAVKIFNDNQPLPGAPSGNEGWFFKPSTGELRCNSPETTSDGAPVFSF